jgi:hypothetical protein
LSVGKRDGVAHHEVRRSVATQDAIVMQSPSADNRRTTMSKWIALGAAAALAASVTMASAQNTSTPGAGAPGQNQAGADQEKSPGQPYVKDTPPSITTGQTAPAAGAVKRPTVAQGSSTPGAGAPGQNQAGGDQEKNPGQPAVKDTPPSITTGQAPKASK